jgi:hypothetical protein
MPKILIKEIDRTSAGSFDDYRNYSVLLAGFADGVDRSDEPTVEPDFNGVYEFTSQQDFVDTIGMVSPKRPYDDVDDNSNPITKYYYHYGNQMAYELLGLGYTVLYRPIMTVAELTDESFWEIFRDKANYDFRFISHGLLSSEDLGETGAENKKQLLDVLAAIRVLNRLSDEAKDLVAALESNSGDTDMSQEEAFVANVLYQKAIFADYDLAGASEEQKAIYEQLRLKNKEILEIEDKSGFCVFEGIALNDNGDLYENYEDAVKGTADAKAYFESVAGNTQIATATINAANGCIANLAKYDPDADANADIPGRGDCVALIELDERTYATSSHKPEAQIIDAIGEMTQINDSNGKFCAMTVPSVVYKMADSEKGYYDNNKKFPGAFHYLACFMSSLKAGFNEWYAAAGYTRGVSSYIVDHTTVKLGEIAINALEPRNTGDGCEPRFACNVIANFRGSYYLWGNRTAFLLQNKYHQKYHDLTASSFLNIRQLCSTIKKQLYVACRRFTFDPNSDALWFNFVNAIKPTLEAMKADQGIRDYKILKEQSKQKATLKAKIRIIPIEAVEDFDLEVSLEDSFGETTAVVTE